MAQSNVKPADGKLGIMVVGNGAVATTFMTGVLMARKGLTKPVGSMTQYDKIRIGKGADKKYLHYKDIVPLADLNDIVFGTWDVYPANAFDAAVNADVLKAKDILPVEDELKAIVLKKKHCHRKRNPLLHRHFPFRLSFVFESMCRYKDFMRETAAESVSLSIIPQYGFASSQESFFPAG